MKRLLQVLGVILLLIIAFGAGSLVASQQNEENVFSNLLNSSVNAAIDSSGVKDKVKDALNNNADAIAKKTGIPSSQVKKAINQLDIDNWKATTLPSDATAKDTNTVNYNGTSAKITTYDDPSIVTINTNGVDVTFEVPAGAQGSLSYLDYM